MQGSFVPNGGQRTLTLTAALILVVSVACASGPGLSSPTPGPSAMPSEPGPSPRIELLASDVAREPADPADAVTAATAINALGLDLYRAMANGQANDNIIVSPASVAIALSMTQLGAVGLTAEQMNAVLHDLVPAGEVGPIDALDQALASRSGTFNDTEGVEHEVLLTIVNSPFGQHGLAIEPAYLDALARGFGAGLRVVDYQADPEAARALINDWVADQTEQRITELLVRQDITPATRFVLVNAIYLKAAWLTPFAAAQTQPAAFTQADGTEIHVPTMSRSSALRYAAGDDWQAVELPYIGNELAMTIVVPADLAAFGSSLSLDRYAAIVSALESRRVSLTLPKFGFTTRQDLATLLAELGMPLAFSPEADFSGITTAERLSIAKVIHEADIDVDEKGTEAAAATAVVMGDIGGPGGELVTLHVDRPFVFFIRDLQTGAVLFLGQVTNPITND